MTEMSMYCSKNDERPVFVGTRQARIARLVQENGKTCGFMLTLLPGPPAVSPYKYLTVDDGKSFQPLDSTITEDAGMQKTMGTTETDAEKIKLLRSAFDEWRKGGRVAQASEH